MKITVKQISSLEKVRREDTGDYPAYHSQLTLAGGRVSYQLFINTDDQAFMQVSVESSLAEYIRIYRVREAVMDTPLVVPGPMEDYITHTPGLMPDILVPLAENKNRLYVDKVPCALWVQVDIPADTAPGSYPVRIFLDACRPGGEPIEKLCATMEIGVIPAVMPEQKLIQTRWIYLDCIAQAHGVEIFSEKHWELIDRYIAAAVDMGVNMLLVPVHTPPLDTEIGTQRPCVQLVDIEKDGDRYHFGFHRFHRYLALAKKHGIRYFEIAHMFTQWGAKATPNIWVKEKEKAGYLFGWHTPSDDPGYGEFLKQYIPAIAAELAKAGVSENTYYHISDEPSMNDLESYRRAASLIRSLIGNSKTYDAISEYAFYEKGLIECPVTIVDRVHEFLAHDIPNQWVYYCCGPTSVYPNGFMAMPSYRVRVMGVLMYKYGIKGFLQWGFNFYNACRSVYPIDPYVTTSSDGAFPSGDPFLVYPGKDCVYPSIRSRVFYEAVQDMDICYALEKRIGKAAVVKLIDEAAGMELRFDSYPRNSAFLLELRQKLIKALAE